METGLIGKKEILMDVDKIISACEELKAWIDNATYEQLLRRWRFSPAGGDPIFQDEIGDYYSKVMFMRRDEIGPDAAVAASKSMGWD